MHISLDSALGRQRRLNSVGESVFQIAPNPSAGYSLRSLTGGDPAVVRVRRASDNSEKDFNSSGVSSGELVNWVNAQVVPPLDVRELVDGERTGALIPAAAAYSLRNLSTSYTGDVVDVRRSSDNAEDSFSAAEVADGTLTTWVNTDVNLYTSDFSVDADGLTSSNGTLAGNIDGIDGVDDTLRFALSGGDTSHTVNVSNAGSGLSYTLSFDYYIPSANTALDGIEVQVTSSSYTSGILNVTDTWTTVNLTLTPDATGTLRFRTLDGGSATPDGDGDVLYIKNIVFTQTTADGFVTQWYDQSGNANHATQTDAASQPKIVDAGSLVSGGLDFDGVDDHLDSIPNLFSGTSAASSFVVGNADTTAASEAMFSQGSNNIVGNAFVITSEIAFRPGGNTIYNDDFVNANPLLLSTIAPASSTSADVSMFLDGSTLGQISTTSAVLDYSTEEAAIGQNFATSASYDGRLSEIIIYNSDQSDNRTAFEANIGETYGIDLPSGVDTGYDQVDGFVETWYDQSGNGNDAVQETASNQPKIVDAGNFLNELLFEGSQLFDTITLSDSAQPNSIFTVSNTNVASQTRGIYGTNQSQAGYYRSSNKHAIFSTGTGSGTLEGAAYVANRDYLRFDLFNGASSVLGVDGNTTSGTTGDDKLDRLDIGDSTLNGVNPLNGGIKELILYTSDQSANRAAIETNINNQYDIY